MLAKSGKLAIRFHDGDPSLFSAIREQIDKLEEEGVNCKVIPGVTAVMGASSVNKFRIDLAWNNSNANYYKSSIQDSSPTKRKNSRVRLSMVQRWHCI